MDRNEAKTRRDLIDKKLDQSGWKVNDPLLVTTELDIWTKSIPTIQDPERPYEGHLFADYALLGKNGKPIAVVEAKRTSVDAEKGKLQALNYAEKIKDNIGFMPFVFYTNGFDYFFWDSERYPPRKIFNFPTISDLERIQFQRDKIKPLSVEMIDTKIAGRPFQMQAIRKVLEDIENQRRKFLLVMATGTGKTRTAMALLDVLMRANRVQRVLFLVDRIALQKQALEAFAEHLPNAPVWPKQKEYKFAQDRRVYVTTYPTMLNIIEQEKCPLSSHFFDIIIADESHRSIYNVYKNIFDYFDAMQLGLTATPKDHVDHNTFLLFECENGLPSFSYTYEEALKNIPPYLSNFQAFKIRTKFQQEGINSKTIADHDRRKLLAEGRDPEEIDFSGTELEKKISNKGTNALIVREFMEECIKDPNGVLPGKTIFFAISKKHAYRLCDVFNALYPEYRGRLAEVIISDIRGVHGKGGILDRFKNQDMPRIAISVDMLDTGIDILEIVNLVFAKPVFSYSKFWQMIGRGTRILNPDKIKPWCPKKDKFLIMDCWENFEYFKLRPEGKEPNPQLPLPVRLFHARVNKLSLALEQELTDIVNKVSTQIIQDIISLPKNSVVTLEGQEFIDQTKDEEFFKRINPEKIVYLQDHIAPLMRALSESDFKAMRFELDLLELSIAKIDGNMEQYDLIKESVLEKIDSLPLTVNIVARKKDFIRRVLSKTFWIKTSDDDYDEIVAKLAPLMRYRQKVVNKLIKTNLTDLLEVKEYIEFGPQHESMNINAYKLKVEKTIQELIKTNPVLQKIILGEDISDEEINDLATLLKERYPNVSEENLRKIYDNQQASFIEFIKHILGIKPVSSFFETISELFDAFIRSHNVFSEHQIRFLMVLKSFILQKGSAQKRDLISAPFTQLHPQGIRGLFNPSEIDEIISHFQILTL